MSEQVEKCRHYVIGATRTVGARGKLTAVDEGEAWSARVAAGSSVWDRPHLAVPGMNQAHRRTAPQDDEVGLGAPDPHRIIRYRILHLFHDTFTADGIPTFPQHCKKLIAKCFVSGRINHSALFAATKVDPHTTVVERRQRKG